MFENEIKFISDFTLNKVKELGSFITVEKFLSIDIHPAIKKYVMIAAPHTTNWDFFYGLLMILYFKKSFLNSVY